MAFSAEVPPVFAKQLLSEEKVIESRNGKQVEVLRRTYSVKKPWLTQWEAARERQNRKWEYACDKTGRQTDLTGLVEIGKPSTIQFAHLNTSNLGLEEKAAHTIQKLQQRVAQKQESGNNPPGIFQVNTSHVEKPGDTQDWRAGAGAPAAAGVWRPSTATSQQDDTARTLKVSNIAPATTVQALRDFLHDRFGRDNISRVNLRQAEPGAVHGRGFGFVTFATRAIAERALIELTDKAPSMDHRVLSFDWARSPGERTPGAPSNPNAPPPL